MVTKAGFLPRRREEAEELSGDPQAPPSLWPLLPASPRADGPVSHTAVLLHKLISGWLDLIWFPSLKKAGGVIKKQ